MRLLASALLANWIWSSSPQAAPSIQYPVVLLQALDKVTARVTVLEVAVGETRRFGTIEVTARTCLETPPTEPPESAAFLEIREPKAVGEGELEDVFVGWMFASSPGLSALEHPVYDVWVIDCGTAALFGIEVPEAALKPKE